MLLSICGTPMRTFSKMGISSEKLGVHASKPPQTHNRVLSSPASGKKVKNRLLQIIAHQSAYEWEKEEGSELDAVHQGSGRLDKRTILQSDDDGREVLKEDHVSRLTRNIGTTTHGDATICRAERWRIVDAIARDTDDTATGLHGAHDT